jgi:hypothetical protein
LVSLEPLGHHVLSDPLLRVKDILLLQGSGNPFCKALVVLHFLVKLFPIVGPSLLTFQSEYGYLQLVIKLEISN